MERELKKQSELAAKYLAQRDEARVRLSEAKIHTKELKKELKLSLKPSKKKTVVLDIDT